MIGVESIFEPQVRADHGATSCLPIAETVFRLRICRLSLEEFFGGKKSVARCQHLQQGNDSIYNETQRNIMHSLAFVFRRHTALHASPKKSIDWRS